MSGQLALDELAVRFELSVFGRGARVRIPIRRDEAKLLPNAAILDGRPVQPEWEADGGAFVVDIPEPGQYRLDLAVQPVAHGGEAALGFDMAIPRLAAARLELSLPGDSPAVEAASALGAVRREKQPPRLVAELGPAERLTVRWPDANGAEGAAPAIDAEELFWLKILPGSVIIDARLKLKAAAGQIRRVQLATDPALQLLPLPGPEPAVQVRAPAGQSQIIEFRWARAMAERATVDARFLLVGASSVGNLRLPQLDVLDVRPTKRWLAVSVDPALEHEAEPPRPADAVAVPDFLASWGKSPFFFDETVSPAKGKAPLHVASPRLEPLLARRLAVGPNQWSVATRPRRAEVAVDQTLSMDFDGSDAEVRFDARLTASSGYVFQHRIEMPPALKIDRVSVSAGGAGRSARWSRDSGGAITVFLMDAVAGLHELSIRGRFPAPFGARTPLPEIAVAGGQVQSYAVQLLRRRSVSVRVEETSGLAEVKGPPAGLRRPEESRLVGWFRAEGDKPPKATLLISAAKAPVAKAIDDHPKPAPPPILREETGGGASVSLADVRMAWQLDGSCRGETTFQVEPGKAAQCPLTLPAGFRLIEASVGGMPLPPTALGPRAWLLPLGPERTVQRMEIIFDNSEGCHKEEADAATPEQGRPVRGIEIVGGTPFSAILRRRLRAPTLGDLPVRTTRWTVAGPSSLRVGEAEGAAALQTLSESVPPAALASAAKSGPAAALWLASLDDPERVTRLVFAGQVDSLLLRYKEAGDRGDSSRLIAAALVAALIAIAAVAGRRARSGDSSPRACGSSRSPSDWPGVCGSGRRQSAGRSSSRPWHCRRRHGSLARRNRAGGRGAGA